jgi:hypothetical protein
MPRNQFADTLFVRIVGVGVQQAHGDATNSVLDQLLHRRDNGRFIERFENAAVETHPTGHFSNQMQWNETARFHPKKGITVAVGHRLPSNLDQMAGRKVTGRESVGLVAH